MSELASISGPFVSGVWIARPCMSGMDPVISDNIAHSFYFFERLVIYLFDRERGHK